VVRASISRPKVRLVASADIAVDFVELRKYASFMSYRLVPLALVCIVSQSVIASSSVLRPTIPLSPPQRTAPGFIYELSGTRPLPMPLALRGRVVQAVVPANERALLLTEDGRVHLFAYENELEVDRAVPPDLADVVLIGGVWLGQEEGYYFAALESEGRLVSWRDLHASEPTILQAAGEPLTDVVDFFFDDRYSLWTLSESGRVRRFALYGATHLEAQELPNVLQSGVVRMIRVDWSGPYNQNFFLKQDGTVFGEQDDEKLRYGSYEWNEETWEWSLQGELADVTDLRKLTADGWHLHGFLGNGSVIVWSNDGPRDDSQDPSLWFQPGYLDPSLQGASQIISGAVLFDDGSLRLWDPEYRTEGSIEVPEALMGFVSIGNLFDPSGDKFWGVKDSGQLVVWSFDRDPDSHEVTNVRRSSMAAAKVLSVFENSANGVPFLLSADPSPFLGLPLEMLARLVAEEILSHEDNYGLASRPFLLSAVADYLGPAKEAGRLEVQSAPQDFGLYSEESYQQSVEIGRGEVRDNPAAFNLYSADSIMDLNLGGVMLQKSQNTATVYLQLQTASSLDEPFVDADEPVEISVDLPGTKGFLRVRALGPQ
jgi:hypothetical protein